jgi:uncharacterized membrane protein
VIYGLAAALGWGFADFFGALAGRRTGSLVAVVVGQLLSAAFITVVLLASGHGLSTLAGLAFFVVMNGLASMTAYASHYRALELGPVAVVSPIGAGYAVVGVLLAIAVLGERPTGVALSGIAITVCGTALVSTDLTALRAGMHRAAPGLRWAIVSSIGFGVAGFLLGYLVQRSGDWIAALFVSRWAMLAAFVPLVLARRRELGRLRTVGLGALGFALIAGLTDILGVTSYSAGAEAGYVSIVLAASAVFPIIAVMLSFVFLQERLAANQYLGIALVVVGLLLLGAG